jgi:hypothetical protein
MIIIRVGECTPYARMSNGEIFVDVTDTQPSIGSPKIRSCSELALKPGLSTLTDVVELGRLGPTSIVASYALLVRNRYFVVMKLILIILMMCRE